MQSRKNKDSKNLNRVVVQVGAQQTNKDILEFQVYDGENTYTIGELLDKILVLQDRNVKLEEALKAHETKNNTVISLISKSEKLLSAKVAELENQVETLINKCKYL